MDDASPVSSSVNSHYLNHVVATASTHEVHVTEDIYAGNGTKLLARGARVDANTRDRLLQHKLVKPLEECLEVLDDNVSSRIRDAAESLLDEHAVLRALCLSTNGWDAATLLTELRLSPQVKSLVSLQASAAREQLAHMVGVSMLAASLARSVGPADLAHQQLLATAGLVHDVGELYIDPELIHKGAKLSAAEWRHIAAHPLTGARVLSGMPGAGGLVAEAVLLHHERLDGFGYPRGAARKQFNINGQTLAVAEWLMGIVESGVAPLTRARMAERLVPGEFGSAVLEAVANAAKHAPDAPVELSNVSPLEQILPRIERLAATLDKFRGARDWLEVRIASAGPDLRLVLMAGLTRMLRIQTSFSSTGLDIHDPQLLLAEMAALQDPHVYVEIVTLVSEMEWRMRELEREQRMRAGLLRQQDEAVVVELHRRVFTD